MGLKSMTELLDTKVLALDKRDTKDIESIGELISRKRKSWNDIKPWEEDYTSSVNIRESKAEEIQMGNDKKIINRKRKIEELRPDEDQEDKFSEDEFVPETKKSFLSAMHE